MQSRWDGWARYGMKEWVWICDAVTEEKCWKKLDRIPDQHGDGKPVSKLVLPVGERPDKRTK
jgi:hypothetical protein